MNTLLLDVTTWDLTIDGSKNIAVATGAYAIAQDVASALRLFSGELWYDTTQGVPYFADVLGQSYNQGLLQDDFNTAALSVPEVVQAVTKLTPPDRTTRELTSGTVAVSTSAGTSFNVII